MTGLFGRISSLYLRAVSRASGEPEWSADTATCAAQCGQPVILGESHYTVVRTVERVEADGTVAPLDGDELAFVHVDCWPRERADVTLRVTLGLPDYGRLSESPAVPS